MIRALGVIPVRLESSRLPEKPIKDINGKSLVQRVWEQACKASGISRVIIATNSTELYEHCAQFGAEVVMTSSEHTTGTDRIAEAYQILCKQGQNFEIIANIQGDMPFINPEVIDRVVANLSNASSDMGMATIATPILDHDEYLRPATVKVALGEENRALYFSRSPIPFWRDFSKSEKISESNPFGYKHMGLYVFRAETLQRFSTLQATLTEKREGLEQLRALANGISVSVELLPRELVTPAIEVDTSEDLERAIQYAQNIE